MSTVPCPQKCLKASSKPAVAQHSPQSPLVSPGLPRSSRSPPVTHGDSFVKMMQMKKLGETGAIIGPLLGHRWPTAGPKNIFGDMGL